MTNGSKNVILRATHLLTQREILPDVQWLDLRSREKNREIALRRLHDAVDLHLNGDDSVSRQIARLEAEQKRRRKETRAKHREEKAAAKLKASSEEETTSEVEGESKMLRLLTTHFSLDWVDGS